MKYFKSVYGSPASKSDHINVICTKNNFKSDELIFFGDSYSDLEASTKNGVKFVLMLHKHNKKYFQNYNGQKIVSFQSLDISSII